MYSPLGLGSCVGAFVNGKVVDWNYKHIARALGVSVDRKNGDDLTHFPIERARLQIVFPAMALGCAAFIPYGWALQQHTSLAVPLALQSVVGFSFVAGMNTLNTLLVDLFPDRAATAAAACNLVRCWLGAIGAAVIDQMLAGMGWGWTFVFLGLCMAVGLVLLGVEHAYGMRWRHARLEKKERKKMEADLAAAEAQAGVASEATGDKDAAVSASDKRCLAGVSSCPDELVT